MSREEATEILMNEEGGVFLVRDSATIRGDYVLCVRYGILLFKQERFKSAVNWTVFLRSQNRATNELLFLIFAFYEDCLKGFVTSKYNVGVYVDAKEKVSLSRNVV